MDAGIMIVGLAVAEALVLVGIGVIGLMMARRGGDAARRAQAILSPAARIRARGTEGVRLARGKSERIVARGKALAGNLSLKWRTALRLVEEVRHPGRPPIESVTEPIQQSRRLVGRLSRLRAAARKASGSR